MLGWIYRFYENIAGSADEAFIAILAAAAFDAADGFAARRLKAETALGAELDSLADLLNFGIAPGIFVYEENLYRLGSLGLALTAGYVVATALRLARFNAERHLVPSSPRSHFSGLPSTAAGLGLAALSLAASHALTATQSAVFTAAAALSFSVLMLSRLQIPTLATLVASATTTKAPVTDQTL